MLNDSDLIKISIVILLYMQEEWRRKRKREWRGLKIRNIELKFAIQQIPSVCTTLAALCSKDFVLMNHLVNYWTLNHTWQYNYCGKSNAFLCHSRLVFVSIWIIHKTQSATLIYTRRWWWHRRKLKLTYNNNTSYSAYCL